MPHLTLPFLAFFAGACLVFWLTPRRHRERVLLAQSALFLGWLDPIALAFLLLAGSLVWWRSRDLAARAPLPRTSPLRSLDGGVVALVLVFLAVRVGQNADRWLGLPALIAPVGFGFAMLRLVAYRIEMGRGTLAPHDLPTFLSYLLFFPTITVGPIHRMDDFLRARARHRWDAERTGEGLRRVLFGYVKVVVIANWLVYNQALGFHGPPADPRAAFFFESLQYGLYLYFSFAGYSDIAIGTARVLGYEVVENFRAPFLQPNLAAFWRAWHMSLSDWCRRYVFLPAYAAWRRATPALFAAMIVLGLWHELSLRFLLWGAWHALGLSLHRAFARHVKPRLPTVSARPLRAILYMMSIALTFGYVVLGFTLIKEPSLAALADTLGALFSSPESPP